MKVQSRWVLSRNYLKCIYPNCKNSYLPLDLLIFTNKFLCEIKRHKDDDDIHIIIIKSYINGLKFGEYKQWYGDQTILTCHGFYMNDKRHGVCKQWNRNGQIIFQDIFDNGEEHGECKEWDSNGKLVFHGMYIDGMKQEFCLKCDNFKVNSVFDPCGHMVLCYRCSVKNPKKCPICHKKYIKVIKTFTIR